MNRTLALAFLTLRSALRSNVALLAVVAFALALAAAALLAPSPAAESKSISPAAAFDAERPAVSGDAQRIRFVQSASLGAAFVILIIIMAVVGGVWLPRQIADKRITTIMSKPVGAWRMVFGSWLGFAMLAVMLLAVFALMSIGCCRFMAAVSDDPEEAGRQLKALSTEYSSKFGRTDLPESLVEAGLNDSDSHSLAFDSVQWVDDGGDDERRISSELTSSRRAAVWLLGRTKSETEAKCRMVFEIRKQTDLSVRYADLVLRTWDTRTGRLGPPVKAERVTSGKVFEATLAIPKGSLDGDIALLVSPAASGYDVVCFRKGVLNVTGVAPFEMNYLVSFAMSGLAILVFAGITVSASTFLSANVSMFFASSIGVAGAMMSFLREFLASIGREGLDTAESLGAKAPVSALLDPAYGWEVWLRAVGHMLLKTLGDGMEFLLQYVLPDWTRFDGAGKILHRLQIKAEVFWPTLGYAAIYCAVCLIAGAMILRRREVGR